MDRLQQREDKYIIQYKGEERWLNVQETTKGSRVPKDSRHIYSRERKMEGDKENPLNIHCQRRLTEEAKVWFFFIRSVHFPLKHLSTVRRDEAILLYALLKGYKMIVGENN